MSTPEPSTDPNAASANRAGAYLAVLQLVFTLGWTTYVIYLPKLAAEVGIAPSAVILILMLDQAIFTITDTAMGIAADKIAPFVGKLGIFVGALTALSCAAFVALPFVAGTGPGAAGLVHRVDRDLGNHLVGAARPAVDPAWQASAPSRRCRFCRRWRCSATAWPARCRPISAWCCAIRTRGFPS